MKRSIVLVGGAIAVVCLVLAVYVASSEKSESENVSAFVNSLPQKDESSIDTRHLKPGLIPPTNKWFSGVALQSEPKTIFTNPLSFRTTESSFSYGLPEVLISENTIQSIVKNYVAFEVSGADKYAVSRYDEVSFDITYSNGSEEIGTVTLAQGSPYVYFVAHSNTVLTTNEVFVVEAGKNSGALTKESSSSNIRAFDGSVVEASPSGTKVTLSQNSFVSMYALPINQSVDPLAEYAGNTIRSVSVGFENRGEVIDTSINVKTSNDKPTAYGMMQHHESDHEAVMVYQTIYGDLRVGVGTSFSYETDRVQVAYELDIDSITESEKELLKETVRQDISATKLRANDTYFSGKEIYRAAQLLLLSEQLEDTESAHAVRAKLSQQLGVWFSTSTLRADRYFYYDSRIKSIVGDAPSFGSEEINDHHFHYGYFIYAASVLARYDSEFIGKYGVHVDALVRDIANYDESDNLFPLRRSYDPYRAHSWASGTAPFDDGNNQESSSEAIHAWVATSLWAEVTANKRLAEQSEWMLAGEAKSAKEYWLEIDTSLPPFGAQYDHQIVALNWGGKRDYHTFFSDEPSAKLGIQLIPLSPTTKNIYSSGLSSVRIQDATVGENVLFRDYIAMYDALISKNASLDVAKAIPDGEIDGANSRSYMYAWIMSQKQ